MSTKDVEILRVLVGSHAHGLATPESDYDYRGVYVTPTREILSLGGKVKSTQWVEGTNEDNTAYEIGHFLSLAVHCNPSILEVFMAPSVQLHPLGQELRVLFPAIWNPHDVANAFGGYSLNQRKKFLDNKENRRWKFATAYLRVLLQGIELLCDKKFNVKVSNVYPVGEGHAPWISGAHGTFHDDIHDTWPNFLRNVKNEKVSIGDVVNVAERLAERLKELSTDGLHKDHEPDLDKVNAFLLKVREECW